MWLLSNGAHVMASGAMQCMMKSSGHSCVTGPATWLNQGCMACGSATCFCRACREDYSCDARVFCDRSKLTLTGCKATSQQQRDSLNAVNPCPM